MTTAGSPKDSERESITAYALATMRAEGLEPSDEAKHDAEQYARGEITAAELQARAAARVKEFLRTNTARPQE